MRKKSVLLLASVLLAVLLASGVALAADVSCPNRGYGKCVGTTGDDTMTGSDRYDKMYAYTGNDTLYGRGYSDFLQGDGGNDVLRGEAGNDTMYGDTRDPSSVVRGSDRLQGGESDDTLYGGPGNDSMLGGPGNDTISGIVTGGALSISNYDIIHGDDGNDVIKGGYRGELYGDAGEDDVGAPGGNATANGGLGNDQVSGGACIRNSTPDVSGGAGQDFFGGFTGCASTNSTVTYRAVDGEQDTISCYENVVEIVRADRLDTFNEDTSSSGEPAGSAGRQFCDTLTIAE